MRKWFAVLAVCAAALAVWFQFSKTRSAAPSPAPDKIAAEDAAVARALARQDANTRSIIQSNFAGVQPAGAAQDSGAATPASAPAGPPAPLQFTNFAPATALENMRRAVRQFGDRFGGNPVGTNPEITSQLSGDNPKRINFIDADAGMRVNAGGELIDPWGTPYFFHQLSGTEMEIRSAGPDRLLWTSDDLVTK